MKRQPRSVTIGSLMGTAILAMSLSACSTGNDAEAGDDCTPKHEFSTIKPGTITVVLADIPPFAKNDNGAVTGVDGDVLRAFAEQECVTITANSVATAAAIPAVQTGRADVSIGDWYRTQARAEIVGLTDPVYKDQMAIISAGGVNTISDIEGQVVGTVDGNLWVEDVRAVLGDNLRLYPTTLNLNQDLESGRITIGIDSYGSASYNSDGSFQVEVVEPDERVAASQDGSQTGFAVNPGNEALLAALNDFIQQSHDDGLIEQILIDNGLDPSASDTGPARLI